MPALHPRQERPVVSHPSSLDIDIDTVGRGLARFVDAACGAGSTADAVVRHIYREIRRFRIYGGRSEMHRHALARRIVGA